MADPLFGRPLRNWVSEPPRQTQRGTSSNLSQNTLDRAEKLGIIKVLASSLFRPRRFASPRAAGFFVRLPGMHTTPWQISERTALLQTVGLAAQLNLAQTTRGLGHVVAGGKLWHAAGLLGLATTPSSTAENDENELCQESPLSLAGDGRETRAAELESASEPIESYLRGDDLISAYETLGRRSMHVDALWRVVTPEPGEKFMAAVDLIVSVRTQQLDAWPEVAVQSSFPACETLRLHEVKPVRCQPLSQGPNTTVILGPNDGVGCLLFRQAGFALSYAEMVHPADFCYDQWIQGAVKDEGSRLVHRLFRTELEKGVILRGRVRGVFVPRIDDTHLAAECYAAFAAGDPPLGT